jgi:hypothetical protein
MINVSITNNFCSFSYVYHHLRTPMLPSAIEIKLKLDTEKGSKTLVAVASAHRLRKVSESTDSPQLAAANAITLIIIIAILYCPRQTLTCSASSA